MSIRDSSEELISLNDRSQSEVIGFVLLLGLTMLITTAVLVVGMDALDSSQQTTEIGVAENELSLFGSKVSEVALGDSSINRVSTGNKDGSYEVQEGTGSIKIEHINRAGDNVTIEKRSLGEVTYTNGDTQVVYQGGGVWRHENGYTSMISPPEFHYRHGTLTLPVVQVEGGGQASGGPNLIAQRSNSTKHVFPNTSRTYDDGTPYENPIDSGTIKVTIQSEYHLGWKNYFEERTEGKVSYDSEAKTASVELITLGDQGHVSLVDGGRINLRAASEEEPMADFTLTLAGDGSSGLNNLDWSLTIDDEEVINLHGKGSGDVNIEITDPNGDTWEAENAFKVDDSGDQSTLEVNLTSDTMASNTDGSGEKEIGELVNELIGEKGPTVDLTVEDSNGAQRVDHDNSFAYVEYVEDGSYVTYLQITRNNVNVRLN